MTDFRNATSRVDEVLRLIMALVAVGFCMGGVYCPLRAQDSNPTPLTVREKARSNAWYFGYPQGLLFHTAFDRGFTTRFALLKASLVSKELERHLSIDERQRAKIKDLRPIKVNSTTRDKLADENAQPDEQLFDPNYFDFLRPEQLRRLDVMCLRFDGYCAISRQSLAKQLDLSEATRAKIVDAIVRVRERLVLPRFRLAFAARLPDDFKFRSCQFVGSIGTQLNLEIIALLTDDELHKMQRMLETEMNDDAIQALESLWPLPDGVNYLPEVDKDQE